MLLRIRGGPTVHVGGIWSHFVHLTKSVGLLSAIRVAGETGIALLRRGVEFDSPLALREVSAPSLRGAPLQWDATVRNLLKLHKTYADNLANFDLIGAHARLHALIERSGNRPEEAVVSVLIPAFNSATELAVCLESIFSFPSSTPLVVIVGDDASPDVDLRGFSGLPGVQIVRHPTNIGYIRNVNAIAQLSSTEFIVTLNQDTIVLPGWLDELAAEFVRTPNCGVAGPRILDSEFKILEAGALLFRNAEAAHRGRGRQADDPKYNFSTLVDYVSGCVLFTRRDTWQKLGGLSADLAPAYYDDVDYCLRTQNLGLVVKYSPLSCVIHFEGTSMGRNEHDRSSIKHFQVLNREKVSARYPHLATRSSVNDRPWPDSHSPAKLRCTCVLETVPNPNRDGGAVDFALFIEYLLELGYQISVLFTSRVELSDTNDLRSRGVQCVHIDDAITVDLLEKADVVISFGIVVGVELSRRSFSHSQWIHHTSDCATRRLEQMNDVERLATGKSSDSSRWFAGLPRNVEDMWEIERQVIEQPSISLVVSAEDLDYYAKRGVTAPLQHFPILKGFSEPAVSAYLPPAEQTISFVGSFFHSPNPDAVEYFLVDIWPHVQQQLPDATFLIWGSNISTQKARAWSLFPNVCVRGWFANWDEVINETRAFVSPIRFGAGMKHKVIESILRGRPVIGTRSSFDGLEQSLLSPAFVSDDPQMIASLLTSVLTSSTKWQEALHASLSAIGNSFYRSVERERVQQVVKSVLTTGLC